jgi:hypothetical protein
MQGVVHGKTIELNEELGLTDGEQVKLTIEPVPRVDDGSAWGAGLRRCAGGLANSWTEEDDRILAEIYQERQRDLRPEITE